ncbi:hypothetical protein [Wolbachia endosymbiont (group A) of Sicus ferrugineus]|uniref:hypothetical protein n=1 Tax=Wolbachia endosymbiont (group A) of Sicus ferrugineus TaxID=2954056 RepID=UPI00222ED693|nr:hypothetical protein [Wolbachia endosymbiont (group A) of Sicus ferrugineus]
MGNSTKELVNAFNLNNYFSNKINTNFTVEGKKIVGLFASSTNIGEYLRGIGKEIIERHYPSGTVAGAFYNLNCFPFVLGVNPDKKYLDNGTVKVKLADSTNNEVISNLKVHFANEFERAVISKVVACLQKSGITKEEAYEWVRETVQTGAIGSPYLYCMAFSNEYLKREYDLETFEFFKQAYIKEFNSRLENCGLKSSDFYEYKDDMLCVKNVSNKVIKSVTEYVKKEVALDFRTPSTEDSKVENFKDVLGDFIFKWTGKSINAYEHDIFTDKKEIENGNDFVLVPLTKRYSGQLESLKHKDVYRINIKYKNIMSDIRGKTAKPDVASYENPVYAISNKGIAQLLPKIMESPIAYNQINRRFEFAVDLTNFKRRGSSRFSSTVTSPFNSPTHAGQSGLRTPPNQRKADSGYDSNSPPKPKDSVAHSSSSDPRSSFEEIQEPQSCFLRQVRHHVGAAESRSAGTNTCTQNPCSSLKGADKSVRTTWYVSSPLTTGNDPMSSSLGVFADSPSVKGKESIFSVEPEKQQVTDKSDRESSDECSEAKLQKSESPSSQKELKSNLSLDSNTSSKLQLIKEHLRNKLSKKKKGSKNNSFSDGSTPSGSLGKMSFKRNKEERDSISSSVSAPGGFVSKKPLLSKRSVSERKAKSNPPSKVTSPVHSTINGSIPELPSQGVVGELNMPGDRSSKISADSGLGSLERGQLLPLAEEFSDSSQQSLSIGIKLGNMLSELLNSAQNLLKNPASSTHKGVPGGPKRQTSLTPSQREELYKVFSDKMKGKLNSSSFPSGYEKLLHLLYVDQRELLLLLSEPKAKEQLCSVLPLPPEKMEQVQSSSPEEVLRLFHTFFSNQKISDNFLISSKVDSPKTEKHLQEEKEVLV